MHTLTRHLDRTMTAEDISVFQVNVGLRCNLACRHCELDCSPDRREIMGWSVQEAILDAADKVHPALVDITGGAPELNPHLKRFIRLLRQSHTVQVRTNLTAMTVEGLDELPDFFALHRVHLVASMPCYLDENACQTNGNGMFKSSLDVLRRLNQLGYGTDEHLQLDLIFNQPLGPFVTEAQQRMENAYRDELSERHGITFNRLITSTNVSLARYLELLRVHDMEEEYMQLREASCNGSNIPALMCRHQINIGWDGTLYDCDYNQALNLPSNHGEGAHIKLFDPDAMEHRRIVTGTHCFACASCCTPEALPERS
ncbi:arsenosugar biosynthesis radical SAM (seleno)protein ArsS [Desulfobaculum sp. SPO524]|uniref:arsenosugar biosynthesis radical SAM (seleno)protein ArsS n=1 Tax=Desulfobaculum sp. SPO524 TaxID=3378071 RepID=UPI0038526C53